VETIALKQLEERINTERQQRLQEKMLDPDFEGDDSPKVKLEDAIIEVAENFDIRFAKHSL
jgi:hypothetical protein